MRTIYKVSARSGFGKKPATAKPPVKPRKRPSQARAHFTVQAIYEAFVRIWRSAGWKAVTTRAIALECGFAVGTLYEYFPGKQALLSGYTRHCVEALVAHMRSDVVQATSLPWRSRLHRLLELCCVTELPGLPYFDRGMLLLEPEIAADHHQTRAFEELGEAFSSALLALHDAPRRPTAATARALFLLVWGGHRYRLLLDLKDERAWLDEVEAIVLRSLLAEPAGAPADPGT